MCCWSLMALIHLLPPRKETRYVWKIWSLEDDRDWDHEFGDQEDLSLITEEVDRPMLMETPQIKVQVDDKSPFFSYREKNPIQFLMDGLQLEAPRLAFHTKKGN